jgi:uncharacterized protein
MGQLRKLAHCKRCTARVKHPENLLTLRCQEPRRTIGTPLTTLEFSMTNATATPLKNAITWFEIPTLNLAKSQAFYENVLACKMRPEDMGPSQGAVFPYEGEEAIGGALLCGPSAPKPGATGALIYLDASPLLDAAVSRALAAGASLACPRVALPPGMGYFAHIIDLDGNRVGLHALA